MGSVETQLIIPSVLCDLGEVHQGNITTIHSFLHSLFGPETRTGSLLLSRYRTWPRNTVGSSRPWVG